VYRNKTADDGVVFDENMAGEGRGVRHDHVAAYPAVVCYVDICHQKIIVPYGGDAFAAETPHRVESATDLPGHGMGLDIGPETAERFAGIIAGAATIFWNGPMGVAEWAPFAGGTRRVAEAIAASDAYSVVGGGDSVAALRAMGLEGAVSHLSTGGGAGLELIERGSLPGLDALRRCANRLAP